MPELDEGAFVLDFFMPSGTSLVETDHVARRVESVLAETPDVSGYIRRTGAEMGLFATEPFRGDILVSLKPPGQRRPMDEIFDSLRDELKKKVPELRTELLPLIRDQIDDMSASASRSKSRSSDPIRPSFVNWRRKSARSSKKPGPRK